MISIFIYMLVCYGIANTIIYAHGPFHMFDAMHKIAYKIHPQIEEMLSCFICSGWWIGFIFSISNIWLFDSVPFTPINLIGIGDNLWYITVFLDGAFVSASNWLINIIEDRIERHEQ